MKDLLITIVHTPTFGLACPLLLCCHNTARELASNESFLCLQVTDSDTAAPMAWLPSSKQTALQAAVQVGSCVPSAEEASLQQQLLQLLSSMVVEECRRDLVSEVVIKATALLQTAQALA